MSGRRAVAEGVFTWPSDSPRLIGSRCEDCQNHMFPTQQGCSRCGGDRIETVELSDRGTLWTWTIQGFPPKAPPYVGEVDPASFEPFGVGYVELDGQVKVEARLTTADPDRLKIGMPMRLVVIGLGRDEAGEELVTFAFAPDDDDDGSAGVRKETNE
jgi:uncharacterized OB-fold protein